MAPNDSKWLQITPNGYKWLWLRQMAMAIVQHCLKWSQMVPNYPKWSNTVQNGQIWSQNVLNGPKKKKKWSQNFQYCLKWSSMFQNGLRKFYHQFNRIAFITSFNLVLVLYKIVKVLPKKSSKWVRHNQVSWSSFERFSVSCMRYLCKGHIFEKGGK